MSPELSSAHMSGTRVAGLRETRRWLLLLLLSEAWLFAALVGAANWRALPSTDRLALVVAAVCLITGWILSKRTFGLWLVMIAPLCLVLAAAMNDPSSGEVRWIALSVSAGHVAYALVLLTSPTIGMISIAAVGATLTLIWSQRPTNVVAGAVAVAGGWVAITATLASAVALWAAWHLLLRRAVAEDDSQQALTKRIAGEIEIQEGSHQWRAAAVRVHERLLSTIRYVLQSPTLDREGLRALTPAGEHSTLASPADLAAEVRQATAARIAAGIVQLDPSTIDIPVSPEARAAGRAAIVECALNAVLHGGATRVNVAARSDGLMWQLTISDNGRGVPDDATPGLGWTKVLGESLAAAGGSWSHARIDDETVITLSIPNESPRSRFLPEEAGFRQGRILISVPMMALGTIAVAYDYIAGLDSRVGLLLPLVAAVAIAAGITVVARARPLRVWVSSLAILGFAALPFLLAGAVRTGASPVVAAAALTAAGYALIAVSVWSRWWQWLPGAVLWTVGVLMVSSAEPQGDRQGIVIALINCLVIVPVVVVVSAIGTRRFTRTQRALEVQRDVIRREVIRASAAQLIDRQLSACVEQADALVNAIADGAELDDTTRHQLSCLEGLIRATIQVDPVSSGEFSRAAARLVNSAFSHDIPAQVGTLVSSTDQSPLPSDVLVQLEDAIATSSAVSVRVFGDGTSDYLALELFDQPEDLPARLNALRDDAGGEVVIEAFWQPEGNAIVTVSRPIAATLVQ
ncbi:MAG: hypothetical protein ACKOAF_01265 [Actinomycetes bacterium]